MVLFIYNIIYEKFNISTVLWLQKEELKELRPLMFMKNETISCLCNKFINKIMKVNSNK